MIRSGIRHWVLKTLFLAIMASCGNHRSIDILHHPYVASPERELGWIRDSLDSVEIVFWLHNPTSDTCKIERIIPDCECVVVDVDRRTVAPSDSCRLVMKITLGDGFLLEEKNAFIYLSTMEEPLPVKVKYAKSMPTDSMKTLYPVRLSAAVRLSAQNINLQDTVCQSLEIANFAENTIALSYICPDKTSELDIYITDTLEAGQVGDIIFYLNNRHSELNREEQTVVIQSSDGGECTIHIKLAGSF